MALEPHLTVDRPFPGLRPFGAADREFFFGREDQVFSLYRLLDLSRFIAVIGSSGSGKSSLVRAGLLPLTEDEAAGSGGRDWRSTTFRPGDAPLDRLADALTALIPESETEGPADREIRRARIEFALRRSSFGLSEALAEIPSLKDKPLLIVVDQFEELFRYAATAPNSARERVSDSVWRDEAANFVQLLLEISRDRSRAVTVLLTMRSDFIGDCAIFQGLPEAVSAAQFLVPSLSRDQREDVIKKPIEKAAATIEPALVERLLNDASSELDQLPVLQHALLRLWDRAGKDAKPGEPRHLTLAHYRKIGGIAGALSQHANEVLRELPGLELAVEQVFRALSATDKEGRATRRALLYKQLLAETGIPDDQLRLVLDRFRADDCSFIVPALSAEPVLRDETRIDVVHEALLRRWDRISAPASEGLGKAREGWLAAEERDGRFYRALLTLLEGEPIGEKLTLPLAQVPERVKWWISHPRSEAWAERYGGNLARVEQLFADSLAALKAEEKRQAEAQVREREEERRKIEAAEAEKRTRLEHQAAVDRMRAESAQRLTKRTRIAALAMLGVAIVALGLGAYAWQQRTYAVSTAARLQATLEALQVAQRDMQAAEGDRRKAIQGQLRAERSRRIAETERLKETQTLQRQTAAALQQAQAAKRETEIALQQANAALAEATRQRRVAEHQTHLADVASAEAIKRRAALFSQAGREALLSGNDDDAAVLLAAAYGDDSQNQATRLTLGQALQKMGLRAGSFQAHDGRITVVQVNPRNANQIATAGADGVKLWDTSGKLLHVFNDQSDLITSLAYDPTGRYLATAARDGTAKIRDLKGIRRDFAAAPIALGGHLRRINSITFNHAGTRVLTAGGDGTVKLWNAATGAELTLDFPKATDSINDALFTPDDRFIVLCSSGGSLEVLDATTGKQSAPPVRMSTKSPLVRLAVAPGGAHLVAAAGAADGGVLLYDIGTHELIKERHDHTGGVNAVAFDSAGRHVVSASDDGTARVLDARSGELTATLSPKAGAAGTAATASAAMNAIFSPTGEMIATTYKDGTVALWTSDGAVFAWLRGHQGETVAADFAPNGDLLVTGGSDGKVFMWHSSVLVRADSPHKDAVESIVFAHDGKRMLSASRDGTAALWQLGDGLTRQRTFAHSPGTAWVTAANFSADGSRVVTAGGSAVKIWNADAPNGAPPLATIAPTVSQERFSDALFVGNGRSVMVAQRSINEARNNYLSDRWIEWSADGKRKVADEPGWQRDIDQLQLSRNGHLVLAVSPGFATLSWIDARYTYSYWDAVSRAALANEHNFYALGLADGSLDVESLTGVALKHFTPHQGRVSAVAFSPDDKWLASAGSGDLVCKIWDVQGGRLHATLVGHAAEIESIAFSPKGATLVLTTSLDGTAKLWDRDTGNLLASNSVPGSTVSTAVFTPDGTDVVLGATDGEIALWHLGRTLPAREKAAKDALAAVGRGRANMGDPLLHQAEEEVTVAAGETNEMARRAATERVQAGLQAASTNQPARAASDLLPPFIAGPSDPSLRLAVAALSFRFTALRATLSANSERIERVAFAENGARLVTTSFDNTARTWDPRSGRLLGTLAGFDSVVAFLSTQRHGNLAVAAALGDSSARVWNLDSGRERYRLPMYSVVRRIAFSGDGSRLVGVGQDGRVRVWNAADGRQVRDFIGSADSVVSVSADGNTVAISGVDKRVELYDVRSGKRISNIDVTSTGSAETISLVALHPTLPFLLTKQKDVIGVWTRSGRLVRTLHYPKTLTWATFGESADVVAATGDAGPILWRGGRTIALVRPDSSSSDRRGAFTEDYRRFFSVGSNRSVAMWDAKSGKLLAEYPGADSDYFDADASRDGSVLATAGNDGLIHIWDTAAGTPSGARLEHGAPVADFQVDAAGKRLLTRSSDGSTRLWDVASGNVLWSRTLASSAQSPYVHLAQDGASVTVLSRVSATGAAPRWRVAVLRASDGREMRGDEIAADASASPSGRYALWRQGDQVHVLDAQTGQRTGWQAPGMQRAHFGATDALLVTEDQTGTATVWRREGIRLLSVAGANESAGAAESRDARRLLTFGPGIDSTLWDTSLKRPVTLAILPSSGDVTDAEFSSDGSRILTTSTDGTLHVWSGRGEPIATLGGAVHLTNGRFSSDNRFVIAVADNGELSVWDARGSELINFPTRSRLPIASRAVGNLNLFAADGNGVMLYRIGAAPTPADARLLARRLNLTPSRSGTAVASAHR